MLQTVATAKEAFEIKKPFDGVLIEPSAYINSFLVRSLDKFGVIKAPNELIDKIRENPEKNIGDREIKDIKSPLKSIFLRPDFNNTDGIFLSVANKIREGRSIYATNKGAAMFFEWIIQKEVDIDFNVNIDVEEVSNAYAEIKNKDFKPLVLERLLKLFAIFYGKEFKKDNRFISAVQLNLLDADKSKDISYISETNFKDVSDIVKTVYKKHKNEFSSNNIFNKILEELKSINKLKEEGFEVEYINSVMVLKPTEISKKTSKEEFLKMLEG